MTDDAQGASTGLRRAMARRMSWYLAAAILALGAVAWLHHFAEARTEHAARETSERLNVALGATTILKTLEGVESDLGYLADELTQRDLYRPDDPQALTALARTFLAFAAHKRIYDQVRFIASDGKERVRVNYEDGQPRLVAVAELQDKSDRYYFRDTLAQGLDEVYISPFDLNVERGRVETPIKPVIRFATPVSDRAGNRTGILVLNYLGERLLAEFRAATANISDHVMLVNAEGHWLVSPRAEDEWSFMRGLERTFATQRPAAWKRIGAEEVGQFETASGIVTFETVNPLLAISGAPATAPPEGSRVRSWKIVSILPFASFATAPASFARRYLPLYLAMLAMLAAASILLARSSARHRAAEERLAFERRFREVLKDSTLVVAALDAAGNIVFCNDALVALVGRAREELVGRDWVETLVAPESRESGRRILREAHAHTSSRHESWILGRDGTRRLVAWHDTPMLDAEGEFAGVTLMGEDVTESREVEERNLLLARAVDQSPATVMITDRGGAIEYVNPKFTNITGYTFDEVRGLNPRILKSGHTAPEEYARLWRTVSEGGEWRGIMRNRKKNGDLYWEAAVISGVRNVAGEIAHYIAVKEDITERRRAEERFRHCVECAPCALVLADREGRILLVNRQLEKLFGYRREELFGKPVEMLLPEELREHHVSQRRSFHASPQPRSMGTGRDLVARRREGERFPVEIGLIPAEEGGEFGDGDDSGLVLASVIDITERRRLEAELVDRDRRIAENNALAAVGRMANMVAHDIRNPLSTIKMSLQILGKKRAGQFDRDEDELNKIALEQVRYMEEVLDDLMSYSKDNGLSLEWLEVNKLLDAAVLLVQRHIDRHAVAVRTRYQAGLPNLHGDRTRLRRAFTNLILNAVHATENVDDRKREIAISTHLELAPDRPKIRVDICDNGCGVPPERRDLVFEPFYTTRASGTGLGLAIVRKIVEQHQGTVELQPGQVEGTCMSVVLPTSPLASTETKDAARGAQAVDSRSSESGASVDADTGAGSR